MLLESLQGPPLSEIEAAWSREIEERIAAYDRGDLQWRRDPQGLAIGGYGLFLQPSDMAKIGYLYLQGGRWAGEQLVPPEWVAKTFHPQVEMQVANYRYSNGWWTIPDKRATWLSNSVFEIVSQSVLEGAITRSTFTFTGRDVDIVVEANGFRTRLHGEADE